MVAWALGRVAAKSKFISFSVLVVVLAFLASKTIARNAEWQSNFTIHAAGAKTCSNNVKLLSNFGLELYNVCRLLRTAMILSEFSQRAKESGLTDSDRQQTFLRAESLYREALRIDPFYSAASFNLGNLLQDRNQLDEAAKVYKKTLERPDPSRTTIGIMNNLASVLYFLEQYDESETTFKNLLEVPALKMQLDR